MLQSLRVVTPPAAAPVSVALAKQHLRIDNNGDDELIAMQISVAVEMVEAFLNRSLVAQTLSYACGNSSLPNGPYVGGFLPILPLALSWPMVVSRGFDLPRAPVQAVSSVSLIDQCGNTALLVAPNDPSGADAQYHLDFELDPARVRINGYGYGSLAGLDVLSVVYVAGYASVGSGGVVSPGIPAKVLQAVLMLTAWLYERRGDETETGAWPPAIERLLWPHRLVTFPVY